MKTLMTDIEIWHPTESPLAIEYNRSVLDEVRDQAVAGFRRLSRGGVEVGGILYGIREEGKVRIVATEAISCEYKFGPAFILSDKDKNRLLDRLAASESDEKLEGLSVVGWYISHPRATVALTDRDLEIFNEFFPAIWNVTLVLKPEEKSIRGGFFVREARGSLNFAQSYQEFELALPRSVEGATAVRQIADQVSSSFAAQNEGGVDGETQRRRGGRRDVTQMPMPSASSTEEAHRPFVSSISAGGNGTGSNGLAAAPALEVGHTVGPQAMWSTAVARPRSAMLARRGEHPRRLKWRWLVLWVLGVAGIVGASYVYREFTTPAPLGLKVTENNGDLIVEWNPAARPFWWAVNGTLEIRNSDLTKSEVDLNLKELAAGKYQYGGINGDTSIRLAILGKMGFRADESTRYLAQVPQTAVSTASKPVELRDRRKLQVEILRLRGELDKSKQRVKELESLLYNR